MMAKIQNATKPPRTHERGITILFVILLLSVILTISVGVFTLIFGQISLANEMENSFLALYAADQGTERMLRLDRTPAPLPVSYNEIDVAVPSGACFTAQVTKVKGVTRLDVAGKYLCNGALRVTKRAFQLSYPSLPPEVAHWSFDEGSGLTAADSSGNNNMAILGPASLAANPAWQLLSLPENNYTLRFDGNDDITTVADSPSLDAVSEVTIIGWIRLDLPAGGIRDILHKGSGSYRLNLAGGGNTLEFRKAGIGVLQSIAYPGPNWHHVAAILKGSTQESWLCIDGICTNQTGVTDTFAASSDNLFLGAKPAPSPNWFRGCIEELRIWNQAITPQQVAIDFDSYKPPAASCP